MPEVYHDVGTVQIGAESYQLVREDGKPWGREFSDEPPWAEGVPAILSEPSDTWHHGGLKSRPGYPGTTEYGKNTDCRWPGRILPGPKTTNIAVTGPGDSGPVTFFEALGHLWVVISGTSIYQYVGRIDPATDQYLQSKSFVGKLTSGLRWEVDSGLVCEWYAAGPWTRIWEVTAIGTPDTWASGGLGQYLAAGVDRLFCVDYLGTLRNVVSGLNPLSNDDFSDLVQCGDTATEPTGIVAYGRTVLVGKPEGAYGVNPEGDAVPLIKRIVRDDDNFRGMTSIDPYIFLPHLRGLYRWMPGFVESVGIETEVLNESPVRGNFSAFCTDGKWVLGAINEGSGSHIMVARERNQDEPGLGPYVWDTLIHFPDYNCNTLWLSGLWDPPRLWMGLNTGGGAWAAYAEVSAAGGAPDVSGSDYRFATSGTRYTHRYNFGDWENKDFPKVALTGKGITANEYWELYYSVDGAAYSKLDIDGADMKLTSSGRTTFYLPQTAVGREIQFRFNYTGTSETAPAEIVHFEPFAVPQSRKVPVIPIMLKLAVGARSSKGVEHRTAQDQLNDLITLSESPIAIALEGPWGDISGWLRKLRVTDTSQVGHGESELVVEAVLQRREES